MNDTICAISTPAGLGAIAMVRVSGPKAFAKSCPLFEDAAAFASAKPRFAHYANICDGTNLLDQVVVTKFVGPHSFSGEDMVEISCHGSLYIQKRIVELLVDAGCRMALPGEFSQRAFLNGKLDLPQAEAIADLIDSQTESAHRLAINQLRGEFSNKLKILREQLVNLASLIELELDFSEEEVEFANRDEFRALIDRIDDEVSRLIRSFKLGNALKTGIPVAIVGKPNVGKSTLLNVLLQHDRAIVSNIPGTTRDTIEDTFNIQGTLFRFIDTAGIRQSEDQLEMVGVERTYQAINNASVIMLLVDVCTATPESVLLEVERLKADADLTDKQLLVVANKVDEWHGGEDAEREWQALNAIFISAKKQLHIDRIEKALVQYVREQHLEDASLLTNERHYALLSEIAVSLQRIRQGLDVNLPTDLLAEDVRAALYALGELTGTISTDDLLNTIFGKFCIGK